MGFRLAPLTLTPANVDSDERLKGNDFGKKYAIKKAEPFLTLPFCLQGRLIN
jgi:hypothetical protein